MQEPWVTVTEVQHCYQDGTDVVFLTSKTCWHVGNDVLITLSFVAGSWQCEASYSDQRSTNSSLWRYEQAWQLGLARGGAYSWDIWWYHLQARVAAQWFCRLGQQKVDPYCISCQRLQPLQGQDADVPSGVFGHKQTNSVSCRQLKGSTLVQIMKSGWCWWVQVNYCWNTCLMYN